MTCSIYSSAPLGRQGPKTKTSGCAIARAFQIISFDLLNRNTSKVVQNRDSQTQRRKACFSPHMVQFTSCEFSFSGDTLWLAKHGKGAKNVVFCSKQRPWHELAAKHNNNRLVALWHPTLKKRGKYQHLGALNSSLVQTHLRFRYLRAYSKWRPLLGQHR